jgi:hypothetical protein
MEATPTCFGLQGNHHQGANSQYLAKLTHLVYCGYRRGTDVFSVMAA